MASGLLSLKWNHHRSTFLHVLANIRQKESYCDVTLACAGKFYSAHKLVLSTCSEYFEEMFERTQCKHPVIVLKDIGADELEALLSYMYDGEVNVLQENLSSLIKAAECLKIKGLAVADSDPSEHSSKSSKDKSSSSNSNGKDVHRSHNSNSISNSNNHSFQSDSSSRQFRNSSGGVKRPSLSSKQDDGPSKRRRPEPSSSSSTAASPARRQSTERPSSAPRSGAADGKDGDDDGSDVAEGAEDGGNSMEGTPSAADDQPHDDGGPDDARSFAQGLSEQTGVKAEPVEIIDSDDMGGFDAQTGDGGSHDASDAEFTEEKFAGGGADANDPSLWGGPANNDMFSQPSTSSFTGQDGSNSNDNNSGGGKGGAGSSILPWESTVSPPAPSATPSNVSTTTTAAVISTTTSTAATTSTTSSSTTTMVYLSHEEAQNALDWIPKMEKLDQGVHVEFQPAPPSAQPVSGGDLHQFLDSHLNPTQQHLQQLPMPHQHPHQHQSQEKQQLGYPSYIKYQQELPPDSFRVAITEGPANQQGGPTTSATTTIKGKTFYCNLCEYSTALFGNLKTHFRQHTKEKPFACHLCDYKARQQSNLKTHMRKHTGEKPYVCEFCDYKSSQHSNLKIHRMLHTGERPFECPICYKKFSRHGYFHSHYTLHPEHHLRPCPYCQV